MTLCGSGRSILSFRVGRFGSTLRWLTHCFPPGTSPRRPILIVMLITEVQRQTANKTRLVHGRHFVPGKYFSHI